MLKPSLSLAGQPLKQFDFGRKVRNTISIDYCVNMTAALNKRRLPITLFTRSCGSDISDPQHPRHETETPASSYALKIHVFITTLQVVMAVVLFIGKSPFKLIKLPVLPFCRLI